MITFRQGGYPPKARVIKIEDKGKYALVKLKTGRKPKNSPNWINSTWNFVRFLGDAYANIGELVAILDADDHFEGEGADAIHGATIVLDAVSFENAPYVKDGKTMYPKNYSFVVWSWKLAEPAGGFSAPQVEEEYTEDEEEELPF